MQKRLLPLSGSNFCTGRKTLERLCMITGALQRHPQIKLRLGIARLGDDGTREWLNRLRKCVRSQTLRA